MCPGKIRSQVKKLISIFEGRPLSFRSKLGRYEDSVKEYRRADELEPDNYEHLNDLGYSLFEAGKFDEAEEVLKRSISLAPPDYEFPRNNLSELKKKRKETKPER